ncbi:DsbA family oxidoreductase [Leptospira idonii]|uniref:DsbA family oxidoreductase n=1 Tax=Leptospira idonii TaxID=1193500 RepID=A0A4R9M4Y4_9LEPT|nr:DsbA family oxidoreductase [Leptospira idonii]TGN20885.1 DsbA family oxidoreductase [Leptospira idonii]
MNPSLPPLKIDIVSDVVCPWCYVGKRKLEIALEKLKDKVNPEIQWRPYQLNPELPGEGVPYREHLVQKFGNERGLDAAWERIMKIGIDIGIPFHFEKIEKAPNTLRLHTFVSLMKDPSKQGQMVDALFQAHFVSGADLTDKTVVWNIVKEFISDESIFLDVWEKGMGTADITQEISYYRQNGVSGVPYYIFQGKYAVSGAQNPEVFVDVIETILREDEGSAG